MSFYRVYNHRIFVYTSHILISNARYIYASPSILALRRKHAFISRTYSDLLLLLGGFRHDSPSQSPPHEHAHDLLPCILVSTPPHCTILINDNAYQLHLSKEHIYPKQKPRASSFPSRAICLLICIRCLYPPLFTHTYSETPTLLVYLQMPDGGAALSRGRGCVEVCGPDIYA